jgi:hypothetical protein
MTIVTSSYRPKRSPRKQRPRTYPENMPAIVTTLAPKKRLKGPVIRLSEQQVNGNGGEQPKRPAIVEPKSRRASVFGDAPEITDEERNRRADLADKMFREIKRRAALPE